MSDVALFQTNRIPVPVDFPVEWPQAGDADLFWTLDRLHYPDPITPLEFSVIEGAVDAGITKVARHYGVPLTTLDRHINSYLYIAIVQDEVSAADGAALAQESVVKLREAMARMEEEWRGVWLPEIQGHLAFWQQFDLPGASDSALLSHLAASWLRLQRVWEIHFLLFFPSMLAISQFTDFYGEIWEEAGALEAYGLLGGFPSKTIESATALWELSRRALASPLVSQGLMDTPPAQVTGLLSGFAEGRLFLAELDDYLREHGYRGDKLSLCYPFWVEDPTPVLKNLADYVAQPERDLLDERRAAGAQRERAVAHALAELEYYPKPLRDEFLFLLRAAQAGMRLKEDHGYWIDYKSSYCIRQLFLECGRRLAAGGALAEAGDVFYLSLAELQALLKQKSDGQGLSSQINRRKASAARFAQVAPPPQLGSLPVGPPPDDPISRMFLKIEGGGEEREAVGSELRGIPGAPGVARGAVKILRVLGDAVKLHPGDILVAESTAPPWTPLFASLAGVITDSGGALSHSAVIAREYGIPAVVGAGGATRRLADGQRVEINGHLGIVRLEEMDN